MNDELTQLRQILTIARTGSFTRAAQELNMTQPALSRNVAAFEARHGIRLFDRGRGGAIPTAVGGTVIAEAETLLRSARDFQHNLRLVRQGEAGRIAIGVGPLPASVILPRLSQAMLRERPRLQLSAQIKPVEHLFRPLMDDAIEMIFGNHWQLAQMPDTVAVAIGALPLAIVVRRGHPLVSRRRVSMDDLSAFPVASAVELPIGGLAGDSGAFTCDNFHILRETVLGTDCVWLSSPRFIDDEFARDRLTAIAVDGLQPTSAEISAVHRRGRKLSPAALAVIGEVKNILSAA